MTDMVTDEQVEEVRQRVDMLREEVQAEKAKASAIAQANNNVVRKTTLQVQEAALQAELNALREANNPENVQAALDSTTGQIESALEPDVVDTTLPPLPTDDGPADYEN